MNAEHSPCYRVVSPRVFFLCVVDFVWRIFKGTVSYNYRSIIMLNMASQWVQVEKKTCKFSLMKGCSITSEIINSSL